MIIRILAPALIALAAALCVVGCSPLSLDTAVCGYDKLPGPFYSCEGTVLVTTMACPTESTERRDCAVSGSDCIASTSPEACVRTCANDSDCPSGSYCGHLLTSENGRFVCERYLQEGQRCATGSPCVPPLVCAAECLGSSADASTDADAASDADVLDARERGDAACLSTQAYLRCQRP